MAKNFYLITSAYYDGDMNVVTINADNKRDVGKYIRNNPETLETQLIVLVECEHMNDEEFKRVL